MCLDVASLKNYLQEPAKAGNEATEASIAITSYMRERTLAWNELAYASIAINIFAARTKERGGTSNRGKRGHMHPPICKSNKYLIELSLMYKKIYGSY